MVYSLPGSSVHGILKARILEWALSKCQSWGWWLLLMLVFYINVLHFFPLDKTLAIFKSSVQSLSRVRLFETPWIAAHQAPLSITNSRSLLKLMPIELVMPSSHLILCCPLLLLPPIPPSIRVFSNESSLFKPHPFIAYFLTSSNQLPLLFPLNPHVLFPLELIFSISYNYFWLFKTFPAATLTQKPHNKNSQTIYPLEKGSWLNSSLHPLQYPTWSHPLMPL